MIAELLGKIIVKFFYFWQQWPHQIGWNLSPASVQLRGKSRTSHLANGRCSSWYITSYWIYLSFKAFGKKCR